ncbi:MAG: UDP-N-acetylmuramoyl-tripeptide--D-alanyl-D-alanine ligase [Ruminococcus sp.]|nr:UDP-N-acetylmuramoyl-tripeptide--D-alanyl-D-alanine ligase [Ruminococcus sp.]
MQQMKLSEIVAAVKGSFGYPADVMIDSISTDTRTITKGSVFLALKGERFDGHDYAAKAMELGAEAVITQRAVEGARCIIVDSTAKALLDLAGYYRDKFDIPLVGVTGSVGKTTTKDMIALVVAQKYKTLKTQGNLNNEIGMPKTLFGLDSETQAAVIEMGMSARGEISRMSMCCKPTVCVITNIGVSHIEKLGSQENILAAKLEILDGAKQGAPLVLSMDDKFLANAEVHGLRKVYYYSVKSKNCDVYAKNIINKNNGVSFDICYGGSIYPARLSCIGVHNVKNALAAFCVGLALDVPIDAILAGIESFKPEGLRQNITRKDGINFVVDCYNAAPDSMRSSISMLDQVETDGMRYCILADMLELGEKSAEFHKTVGKYVADSNADRLYCYGELARNYIIGAVENGFDKKHCMHFSDRDEMAVYLKGKLQSGDSVLLKGSRGMALEEVFNAL